MSGPKAAIWGMNLPRGGGQYGPYGEYEGKVDQYGDGWAHRLRAYFREKMPELQKKQFGDNNGNGALNYSSFVWRKFKSEVGTRNNSYDPIITPIEDHEPPSFFLSERGYDALASVISLPGSIWAIDEQTKAIIERLEPGIHRLFPIEIRMPRGKVYPVHYFILVVGRYLDSLVPEHCTAGILRPLGTNKYHPDDSKRAISGRAFAMSKFGDADLWHERAFGGSFLCMSDRLRDQMRKSNLLVPKHYQMMAV